MTETAVTGKSSFHGILQFSLLAMPVDLYRAASDDPTFNQVHTEDGGKILYERVCDTCGERIPWADIGKGKQIGGVMYTFTDEEIESLPVAGGVKAIRITQFISTAEVDVSGLGNSYFIRPDDAGLRAYTLLRQEMKARNKVGIARFAFKNGSKDSLAIIRAHGQMLYLQRYAWPEDLRVATFKFLDVEVSTTTAEREAAGMLIDTMTRPWDPEENHSEYGTALTALIAAKVAGQTPPVPPATPAQAEARQDIGAVLSAAIEAEKRRTGGEDAA